jgi:hypothetical protein
MLMAHWPARHGAVFDRETQRVMLVRGFLRRPLIVPYSAIAFTGYTEDAVNFSKDLILLSTAVPGRRRKPIRMVMNTTGGGSSTYSLEQVIGAVDCFMDQGNTRAMPLSIKHRIEWYRKHRLTLWHMAWRPLPASDLPRYLAPDSLYQSDLLDPKTDSDYHLELTEEGRNNIRQRALLQAYLEAVWETLDIDQIDPTLKADAEAEFGQETLAREVQECFVNEWRSGLKLHGEVEFISESKKERHRQIENALWDINFKRKELSFQELFSLVKTINDYKYQLLCDGEITRTEYLESFRHSHPRTDLPDTPDNVIPLHNN